MRVIIRFLFGWIMPLILWIEPSLTGNDNKASGRKIASFVFMFMILSTTSKIILKETATLIHVYVLAILVCTYLLLIGIITVQNIVDIYKSSTFSRKTETETKVTETKETKEQSQS